MPSRQQIRRKNQLDRNYVFHIYIYIYIYILLINHSSGLYVMATLDKARPMRMSPFLAKVLGGGGDRSEGVAEAEGARSKKNSHLTLFIPQTVSAVGVLPVRY